MYIDIDIGIDLYIHTYIHRYISISVCVCISGVRIDTPNVITEHNIISLKFLVNEIRYPHMKII